MRAGAAGVYNVRGRRLYSCPDIMRKSRDRPKTRSIPQASIPAIGEGKRGEAGYLGYLLRQAANAQRRRMDQALAAVGLTHPQFLVLTMVRAYPGCSNADIARLAMLTPQTVHAIITVLLHKGLVTRQPNPVHGRILNIELTGAGRELLGRGRARALAMESDLQEALNAAEVAVVRRWLVSVARRAPSGDGELPSSPPE